MSAADRALALVEDLNPQPWQRQRLVEEYQARRVLIEIEAATEAARNKEK